MNYVVTHPSAHKRPKRPDKYAKDLCTFFDMLPSDNGGTLNAKKFKPPDWVENGKREHEQRKAT